jgi:tRNA pseudouridine synthase 10
VDECKPLGGGWNRKRGPPPGVPVMPDSPAALWQIQGAAYNVACRAASMSPAELRRHIAVPPPPPPSKATCRMMTWHQPIYVGGHYLKWARGVPQSPW